MGGIWDAIRGFFAALTPAQLLAICGFGGGAPPPPPPPPPPYPGRRPPPYPAAPPVPPRSPQYIAAETQARADIPLPHTNANSVWDQPTLGATPNLLNALNDYAAGTKGGSVSALDLSAYAGHPELLHDYLVNHGFQHQRKPLNDDVDNNAAPPTQLYWRTDGTTTANPADPQTVPHDIYTHGDGGIVRVKPEGVPDPDPNVKRPQPHAVKAVLYTPHVDNGFDDEAFKVTNAGHAIPKIFSPQAGMRQTRPPLSKGQTKGGYLDEVMRQGHTDI